jgi:hypothetical protein
MLRSTLVRALAALSFVLPPAARAQYDSNVEPDYDAEEQQAVQEDWEVADEPPDDFDEEANAPAEYEEQRAVRAKKKAQADANFDEVMRQQNAPAAQGLMNVFGAQGIGGLGITNAPGAMAPPPPPVPGTPAAEVEVNLREYTRVRDALDAWRKKEAKNLGPAVVLGAAEYTGRAREGSLELRMTLLVTLGHPERWKVVPLVGDDVVLVRAAVGGVEIPVSRQYGYHVWVTRRVGELALTLDMLVPARGPRGSTEYDFVVSRTPVTRFSCRFPLPGLEPKLDAAVRSQVRTVGNTTELDATLAPTTHIHLVGFRDLGEVEGRTAKVYAESTSLLSVGEVAIELFAVVRYTILYGGTKTFDIAIPKDVEVVSADGKGAFRFDLEESDTGTVLHGETAYPIRDNYEISLRLRRELDKAGGEIAVPLPRCLAVEREHGWLGVEVTGKLQLTEKEAQHVVAIDVRQLPEEMLSSAVSPILKAYRYHEANAAVRLAATRLPEKEPSSASVDRVRAFSVVSADGKVLTDMRITLRNRLRHNLTLTLPPGGEVRSALLDGEPAKPSKNEQGGILLPLELSGGGAELEPFTVQVILATEIDAMSVAGWKELALPSVDLPVSSLAWSLFVPAKNLYSAPEGDIERQRLVGTASWHQPSQRGRVLAAAEAPPEEDGDTAGSADTGAMPVRIKLPENGVRLEYERFWIDSGHPVAVSLWYLRSWVRLPIVLLLVLLIAAALLLFSTRWPAQVPTPARSTFGGIAALVLLVPLAFFSSASVMVVALLLGGGAIVIRLRLLAGAPARLRAWTSELPARFKAREKKKWTAVAVLWKLGLSFGLFIFGLVLLVTALRVLWLLFSPLPG